MLDWLLTKFKSKTANIEIESTSESVLAPAPPPDDETPSNCCESVVTESGEINFCGLMLEQTIAEHHDFLHELNKALAQKLPEAYNPEVVGAQDLCKVGKWLLHKAKPLERYSEYAKLVETHRQFHLCAGEVVRMHKNGHFMDALTLLRTDLQQLSEEVEAGLRRLHEQVQADKAAQSDNA